MNLRVAALIAAVIFAAIAGRVYAVTGTLNYNITSTSSSACPGSIPAAASSVGFTTVARCDDFTQTLASNWIDCTIGDHGAYSWYFGFGNYPNAPPCSSVSQQTDPAFGNLAVRSAWSTSYENMNNGYPGSTSFTTTSSDVNSGVGVFYPMSYIEITYRAEPVPNDAQYFNGESYGFWGFSCGVDGLNCPNTNHIESDYIETFYYNGQKWNSNMTGWSGSNAYTGNVEAWSNNSDGTPPLGRDPRQYHTMAALMTGDGANTFAKCFYFDATGMGCASMGYPSGTQSQRFPILIGVDTSCTGGQNDYSCIPSWVTGFNVWFKTVRVISCANWASQMCYTTPKTSP